MGEDMSLDHIPIDCNKTVLLYLGFPDIREFMCLSKDIYGISKSNVIWNSLYYRKWPGRMNRGGYRSQEPVGNTDWYVKFRERLLPANRAPSEDGWRMFTEASDRSISGKLSSSIDVFEHTAAQQAGSHVCNPRSCVYIQNGANNFRCVASGTVHVCEPCRDGFACAKSIESVNDSLWVCPISARSFQYASGLTEEHPIHHDIERSSDYDSDSSCCRLDKRTLKRQRRR